MGWNWWPSNAQADVALAAIGFFCAVGLLIAMGQTLRRRIARRSARQSIKSS